MVKVIIKVVVALGLLAYGAFFLSWNIAPQQITGFVWGGIRYSQTLPLGSLVFIGLALGAALMAIAAWATWATQKAQADKYAATIRKAKSKLQAQLDEINDLRDQVARLEAELEGLRAGDGTWGQVTQADIAAGVEGATAAAEPGGEASAAQAEVDDPDVI
ncbi:hypothetical protein LLH23_18895 [bacterium]|nr:hypothetical protein [bacterium]